MCIRPVLTAVGYERHDRGRSSGCDGLSAVFYVMGSLSRARASLRGIDSARQPRPYSRYAVPATPCPLRRTATGGDASGRARGHSSLLRPIAIHCDASVRCRL